MIKKIRTEDLKLGMFIHDLNSGWMDHSFFLTRFMLRREEQLKKILESGIREVFIDTVRGLDAVDAVDASSQEEGDREVFEDRVEKAGKAHLLPARTTYREELSTAKRIQSEANTVVRSLLSDIRLGRQIQMDKVGRVVEDMTDSILRNQGALISLCRIKERDNYTFQHCVSVCTLLVSFCNAVGMDRELVREAGVGALLHDTGKMCVPDEILNKPGKLSGEEFEVMKSHVDLGVEILKATPAITAVMMMVAREHHERFDGTGYPEGLHGHEISQLGRMAAIVDVYDAITSNRVYHKGMEPSDALQKLFEWSRHHFDEELVQYFIQSLGIYPVGSLVRLESERLAIVVQQGEGSLLTPVVRLVYDIRHQGWLTPRDVDLSLPESGGDRIVAHELPEQWQVNPYAYLSLET